MKRALLLPSTKTLLTFEESFDDKDYSFWQEILDQLDQKEITWEYFREKVGGPLVDHPVTKLMTTKYHRGLLHLAIFADQMEVIRELRFDAPLKGHRDYFGFIPFDLAHLFDRKEAAQLLMPRMRGCPNSVVYFDRGVDRSVFQPANSPLFESEQIFLELLLRTRKAKMNDLIPSERVWMGIYFDKEIARGLHPPVSIRRINSQVGCGVFADQRISPGCFVGEYTGVVRARRKKDLKEAFYTIRYPNWDGGKKLYIIDAEKRGNFTRYINHSETPNLALQSVYCRGLPRFVFVSLREIRVGEQLTFDYGELFWKECPTTPQPLV